MNVCVIGGGHIGTTLSCYIKHYNPDLYVSLLTNHPKEFNKTIICNDIENEITYNETLDLITNQPTCVATADIIFIALPHFLIESTFKNIAPYTKSGVMIGVIPGGGGCEFFFDKYFEPEDTLFGFQRVPFTAKLKNYGNETNLKSWKPYSVVSCLQRSRTNSACDLINACGLKTKKADNYLEIALTPTNPILHTSRIYDIFGDHNKEDLFSSNFKFYVGWTDNASNIMFEMDKELHFLLNSINDLSTNAIRPISEHYESPTPQELTKKINSIKTFQTVYAPLTSVVVNGKNMYKADLTSRMFTEDFPWGLSIIYSYFELFNIEAPNIKRVLDWYAKYMEISKDTLFIGTPQSYGITTKEQLINCYLK